MPNLVRKLVIFAGKDGIVLKPHGSEDHRSIVVEYQTRRISTQSQDEHISSHRQVQLESYGIVGLINVASSHFLVAITQREQVAQIYSKPIYSIADVAILPLSSQSEAGKAILAASQSKHKDQDVSDSEYSDSDDGGHEETTADLPDFPGEENGPYTHKNKSNTSIAEDVAKRKASYGKFASRWFLKQVWGTDKASNNTDATSEAASKSASAPRIQQESLAEVAEINEESKKNTADKESVEKGPKSITNASAMSLLPKVLRSTKMILSSRSFYFAYEFDLTRRFSLQSKRSFHVTRDKLDPLYFWNKRMSSTFLDAGQDPFVMPILQGFVGQRTFLMKSKSKGASNDEKSADVAGVQTGQAESTSVDEQQEYILTLISRRSVKRSGLRYLRRGIDDEGNCANAVETEQVLSSPTWDKQFGIRSFVQVRGSIPLYFSQSPYSFKPVPMLHNSSAANQAAFGRHFQSLKNRYGAVQIAMLVNKHGTEASIGNAYENSYKEQTGNGKLTDVSFEWFDFHAECRGMKFENVQRLVDKFQDEIATWGETVISDDTLRHTQSGIIRTNCMDCLDRTNVAQSAFGQHILQHDLERDGYTIDLLHDESTNWFNTLWADNGDAISRQYASTAALKGDFTRTRKRDWRGQMNDIGLTLSRYYSNMVNDYFSQAVIDVLLGNVSWRIFEDFESSMMSVDPGISIQSAREAAIENCAKLVIQDADEDLIHGWCLMTPAQENTLRTLPFEESVVLLTNAAIYCCKFDWDTEKIASFEKVDIRSISKIRLGTYITSTFTEREMDERLNQGLVVVFTPEKGNLIRVNTRSLSNAVDPNTTEDQPSADGGTGILSWFAPNSSAAETPRTLAFKVIPRGATAQYDDSDTSRKIENPGDIAARISEEIKRVVVGPGTSREYPEFIEHGDIISAGDAKRRTGYLEQLGYSIRKMVWA